MSYADEVVMYVNRTKEWFTQEDVWRAVHINRFKIAGVLELLVSMKCLDRHYVGRISDFCLKRKLVI